MKPITKQTTRFISPEERIERQKAEHADAERTLLDQNPDLYINRHTLYGHAFESHVANSPRSLLNNVLSGQKHGDTKFRNAETQTYCMQEILYNSMREIQDWVKKAQNGDTTLFSADFEDPDTGEPDYIGTGFVTTAADKANPYSGENQVNYIESNLAAIVIKKNPDAPDGWEITTAFPMSHPKQQNITPSTSIRMPNTNLKSLLHQTMEYKSDRTSDVKRLALDLKCTNNKPNQRFVISYQKQTGRQPEQLLIRDAQNKNLPQIKITQGKSGLDLALHSFGRPDIDLNRPQTQDIARKTCPDLYQHTLNLIKANKPFESPARRPKPEHPGSTGHAGATGSSHNISDLQLSRPSDNAPGLEY